MHYWITIYWPLNKKWDFLLFLLKRGEQPVFISAQPGVCFTSVQVCVQVDGIYKVISLYTHTHTYIQVITFMIIIYINLLF